MLSMIGHRHFFTPYETDLQIQCLTYRSTVDAPQAASSCARICPKLRSSQRSRSRSHAVGNERYLRTGVVDDVVFARQHSRLRDVRTMFAARPPADEELGVRGLGCAIGSTVCPTDGVRVRLMLDRVQPNANARRTRWDFRRNSRRQ